MLGAVRKRGIDIILSDSSSKSTPYALVLFLNHIYRTVVAYTNEERLIGDAAMSQIRANFMNTSMFFNRFLGLNIDCASQLQEEEKYIT